MPLWGVLKDTAIGLDLVELRCIRLCVCVCVCVCVKKIAGQHTQTHNMHVHTQLLPELPTQLAFVNLMHSLCKICPGHTRPGLTQRQSGSTD